MRSAVQDVAEPEAAGAAKSSGLADGVYHGILTEITGGTYGENQKLPSENELAARYKVSRPVVRAALERLRQENVIVSRQGAGSFVRSQGRAPALGYAPVESIADIQRCYEFRLTIEPEAARYAALRRNGPALERIATALDLMNTATRQQQHRDDADFAFHLAIAEASNNHYYGASLQALQSHIAVGMKIHGLALLGPNSGLQGVLDEHRAIFASIRDGDAETARDRMHRHICSSRDRLFEGRMLDLSL
ncbi:GntR family transcriptional regulator [Methylobacterium indicum]|uniref:FadR/GntR family transcriptional regulator n=1 Tax=Methylobacterium indicum TaxID=1775910 RepID=UPI000733EDDD|nr:FadR/GntR family transcriptional regulator [Methylobacterium indicum]KTS38500.1 GntR family transcriptional regulator [Methylobacterium indicum]KTS40749.1 GntR family transcriptional regulator [Methylobacterium indicum]KTS53891.1 GntR family transcriptional regulator [Methylobacterium indicum]